ncbi:MAG: DNA repair protein RadB [Candidatus Pacearchaeota archaeon]|nr:MAG: DNA repair protein RadB [Candidatus Pacearchaeota archaeon]
MERISTGSYDFNKWLHGGYEAGIITMIAGPPASGKTNFAILAACSQAKKGKKVIFIDTEGGFSVERVKQIAEKDYEEILKNILILEPSNFQEQKETLIKLMENVKKKDIGLIIVDGMAMHYRLELGDALKSKNDELIKQVNRELAKQMKILSEISRKEKIPIIITNQVYSDFLTKEQLEKGIKPETNIVGGDLFKYWSKCIIELKLENGKRKAILLKHRSLPKKELSFEIREKGIFKKGWL